MIRRIIDGDHSATRSDIDQIIERLAISPFKPDLVPVPRSQRGLIFANKVLGESASSITIHLFKRIVVEEQWEVDTTEEKYLADLHRAVLHRSARLAVYNRRGGSVALSISPTDEILARDEQGAESLPILAVVYSADRGMIVTGYQASKLDAIAVPGDAQWLR